MPERINNTRRTRHGLALIVRHLSDNWPDNLSLEEFQSMRRAFGWLVQESYGEVYRIGLDPDMIMGDMVEET